MDFPHRANRPSNIHSDPHPFSVRDKRVLDHWDSSSMEDWIDEEALSVNVERSVEESESLDR